MLKINFAELDERTDGIDQDFNQMKDKMEEAMEKLGGGGKQESEGSEEKERSSQNETEEVEGEKKESEQE